MSEKITDAMLDEELLKFRRWLEWNISDTEKILKKAALEAEAMGEGESPVAVADKSKNAAFREFLRLAESASSLGRIRDIVEDVENVFYRFVNLYDDCNEKNAHGKGCASIIHELSRLTIANPSANPVFYYGDSAVRTEKLEAFNRFKVSRGIFMRETRIFFAFLQEIGALDDFVSWLAHGDGRTEGYVIAGVIDAADAVQCYFYDHTPLIIDRETEENRIRNGKSKYGRGKINDAAAADNDNITHWFNSSPHWTTKDATDMLSKAIAARLADRKESDAFRGGFIFTLSTFRFWIQKDSTPVSPAVIRAVTAYLWGALSSQYSASLPVSPKLHYTGELNFGKRADIYRFLFLNERLNENERKMLTELDDIDENVFHPQFVAAGAFVHAAGGIVLPPLCREAAGNDRRAAAKYLSERRSGILEALNVVRKQLAVPEIISDTTDAFIIGHVTSLIKTFRERTFPEKV